MVALVPAVLSLSVAVAQSYWTVSGHCTWYQNESWLLPAGAVNVCESELSPLVGLALPSIAEDVPPWAVVLTAAAPAAVHPPRFPASNPPLTRPPPPLPA